MEIEKLIDVLQKEKKVLTDLKIIANNKQVSLVDNNREHLNQCIHEEEKMLPLIQKMENQRLIVIDEFYNNNGKVREDYHLETLIEEFSEILPEEFVTGIMAIQSEMKVLVTDLMKLNKQNMYLINHSRQYLNETMAAIMSTSEKSILDKKV